MISAKPTRRKDQLEGDSAQFRYIPPGPLQTLQFEPRGMKITFGCHRLDFFHLFFLSVSLTRHIVQILTDVVHCHPDYSLDAARFAPHTPLSANNMLSKLSCSSFPATFMSRANRIVELDPNMYGISVKRCKEAIIEELTQPANLTYFRRFFEVHCLCEEYIGEKRPEQYDPKHESPTEAEYESWKKPKRSQWLPGREAFHRMCKEKATAYVCYHLRDCKARLDKVNLPAEALKKKRAGSSKVRTNESQSSLSRQPDNSCIPRQSATTHPRRNSQQADRVVAAAAAAAAGSAAPAPSASEIDSDNGPKLYLTQARVSTAQPAAKRCKLIANNSAEQLTSKPYNESVAGQPKKRTAAAPAHPAAAAGRNSPQQPSLDERAQAQTDDKSCSNGTGVGSPSHSNKYSAQITRSRPHRAHFNDKLLSKQIEIKEKPSGLSCPLKRKREGSSSNQFPSNNGAGICRVVHSSSAPIANKDSGQRNRSRSAPEEKGNASNSDSEPSSDDSSDSEDSSSSESEDSSSDDDDSDTDSSDDTSASEFDSDNDRKSCSAQVSTSQPASKRQKWIVHEHSSAHSRSKQTAGSARVQHTSARKAPEKMTSNPRLSSKPHNGSIPHQHLKPTAAATPAHPTAAEMNYAQRMSLDGTLQQFLLNRLKSTNPKQYAEHIRLKEVRARCNAYIASNTHVSAYRQV